MFFVCFCLLHTTKCQTSILTVYPFIQLCHRVVDGLCGREFPHKGDYSTTWSLQEWLELLGSLTALFRLAVANKNPDEVVRNGTRACLTERGIEVKWSGLQLSYYVQLH